MKRNALCLQLLTKTDGMLIKAIIISAKPDIVNSLSECAHNVLKGNVLQKTAQKTKLRHYRKHLRNLVKRTSLKKKRKLLQTGGFV